MLPPKIPAVPFTCAGARKLGISKSMLDDLVATRRVRRVLRGVYFRSDVPDTALTRARAADFVISAFAVLADRTAAWLHGVDTFAYRELEILPPLETWVLRGHSRVARNGCAGGSRDLRPGDVCVIGGVRVTTPLRTALDLGCKFSRRDALAALDGFMRICGVTREEMYAELPRYFRRRGVVQLRQLVPLADPRSESPGESWVRMDIIDAGLPVPEPQVWVYDDGVPVFRVDLGYPKSRVCVEYDGREFHEGDDDKEHDRLRRKWLEGRGWTVIVLTKDSFGAEAKAAWLDELRVALRLAA